jgi:hypothetical protein
MQMRHRISALFAASAICIGAAATAPAAHAAPGPCALANGKYQGSLAASYEVIGYDSQGRPQERGGTLSVWHSARCQTLWVRLVKLAQFTDAERLTAVSIDYYNVELHRADYLSRTEMTRGSLESAAVSAGAHGQADVNGSFLGDYQYTANSTVSF